jgi:hypothetical protein
LKSKPPTPQSAKNEPVSHESRARTRSRDRSEDYVPTKQTASHEKKRPHDVSKLEHAVERIESQNNVLKQALGTLADAVSEELEDIRKHVIVSG